MTTWSDLIENLQATSAARVSVPKAALPPPATAGFYRSVGLPRGQRADWRLALGDCRGVHLWDCGEFWLAHLDQVDPSCSVLEHSRRDAPGVFIAGAVALGAAAGGALGGGRGAAVGALLGGLLGAALVAAEDRSSATSPATAQATAPA